MNRQGRKMLGGNSGGLSGRLVLFATLGVFFAVGVCPAVASYVTDMTIMLDPGIMYHGPEDEVDPGQFQFLYEDPCGTFHEEFPINSGDIKVDNLPVVAYQLEDAWIQMTASLLKPDPDGDQSSGGVAKGGFYGGATMTLWGTIVPAGGGGAILTDGLILTATVSTDFILGEEGGFLPIPNKISGTHDLDVAGGELSGPGVTGLRIYDGDEGFHADYLFLNCLQLANNGGAVEDFQSMITNGAGTITFTADTPEPVSVSLMGLGALVMLRRRRFKIKV